LNKKLKRYPEPDIRTKGTNKNGGPFFIIVEICFRELEAGLRADIQARETELTMVKTILFLIFYNWNTVSDPFLGSESEIFLSGSGS
jgi:hypothetical protein